MRKVAKPLAPRQEKAQKAARTRGLKRMFLISLGLTVLFSSVMGLSAQAADMNITVTPGEAGDLGALEIIFIFAFLALLPSVLLMMTSFTRIVIVFGFMRNAMGTAQAPPNMVIIGLSIFLSLFIMTPTLVEMNEVALEPYQQGTITGTEALEAATRPVKQFMLKQTEEKSLRLFLNLSNTEMPEVADQSNPVELLELPLTVVTPAFILSELSRAFLMGFLVYLPFLVIDIVVASILMSMGMVMLPPAMISLPFKILLFVLVDGWGLMMETLVRSFQ